MDNTIQSQHLKDEDAPRGGQKNTARGAGPDETVQGGTAGGAKRSNQEDRGAGLNGNVLGRTAGGATRSHKGDRGAGLNETELGRTAEGAMRSKHRKNCEKLP